MRSRTPISGLCGVVILYHPDAEVFENIRSYASVLEKLWVFDNSESNLQDLSATLAGVANLEWIQDGVNAGIGSRINTAIDGARQAGYEWLLTMDQDSCFTEPNLEAYLTALSALDTRNRRIAMVGIAYSHEGKTPDTSVVWRESLELVTSGSFVHLTAIAAVGGMNEQLFIDEVDSDFVYKAVLSGWEVLVADGVYMTHQLGERKMVRSVKTRRWSNRGLHSPLRLYYITRNFLWIRKVYGSHFPDLFRIRAQRIVNMYKNNLLYHPQRFLMIRMILKGYIDFKRNRTGKFDKLRQNL